jgi:hypothetical protein
MYIFSLSTHPLRDVQLGYFHIVVSVNNASMNKRVFNLLKSIPMTTYPEVGLLNHRVVLFLIYRGVFTQFCINSCTKLYSY